MNTREKDELYERIAAMSGPDARRFAVACAQRAQALAIAPPPGAQETIQIASAYAEGTASRAECEAAWETARRNAWDLTLRAAEAVHTGWVAPEDLDAAAAWAAAEAVQVSTKHPDPPTDVWAGYTAALTLHRMERAYPAGRPGEHGL